MNSNEARKLVVKAGKRLVETGLIARTWGNVSCRISPAQFVITPSGRAYETLTPEDIVTVNVDGCSFESELEPSTEKGIHAEVYKQRGDINFVIHTHQLYASAVSPLNSDLNIEGFAAAIIGSRVVAIPHALPGTRALRKNVASALTRSESKAFLITSHGALCLGINCDQAFKVATELEKECAAFINRRYFEISGRKSADPAGLREYFIKEQTGYHDLSAPAKLQLYYNSERKGDFFHLYPDATEEEPFPPDSVNYIKISLNQDPPESTSEAIPPEAKIHHALYNSYQEINAIVHCLSPDILAVSRIGKTIYPLIDDFAMIIGPNVQVADDKFSADLVKTILKKIRGRNAVLIKGNGAICCGPTKSDAASAVMIMEKGCKAFIATALFGGVKPIKNLKCHLMRHIYLNRYSKKALLKQKYN